MECGEALKYICRRLWGNSFVEELDLRNQLIGDEGLFVIIDMLKQNSFLKKINLGNEITNYGISRFFELLDGISVLECAILRYENDSEVELTKKACEEINIFLKNLSQKRLELRIKKFLPGTAEQARIENEKAKKAFLDKFILSTGAILPNKKNTFSPIYETSGTTSPIDVFGNATNKNNKKVLSPTTANNYLNFQNNVAGSLKQTNSFPDNTNPPVGSLGNQNLKPNFNNLKINTPHPVTANQHNLSNISQVSSKSNSENDVLHPNDREDGGKGAREGNSPFLQPNKNGASSESVSPNHTIIKPSQQSQSHTKPVPPAQPEDVNKANKEFLKKLEGSFKKLQEEKEVLKHFKFPPTEKAEKAKKAFQESKKYRQLKTKETNESSENFNLIPLSSLKEKEQQQQQQSQQPQPQAVETAQQQLKPINTSPIVITATPATSTSSSQASSQPNSGANSPIPSANPTAYPTVPLNCSPSNATKLLNEKIRDLEKQLEAEKEKSKAIKELEKQLDAEKEKSKAVKDLEKQLDAEKEKNKDCEKRIKALEAGQQKLIQDFQNQKEKDIQIALQTQNQKEKDIQIALQSQKKVNIDPKYFETEKSKEEDAKKLKEMSIFSEVLPKSEIKTFFDTLKELEDSVKNFPNVSKPERAQEKHKIEEIERSLLTQAEKTKDFIFLKMKEKIIQSSFKRDKQLDFLQNEDCFLSKDEESKKIIYSIYQFAQDSMILSSLEPSDFIITANKTPRIKLATLKIPPSQNPQKTSNLSIQKVIKTISFTNKFEIERIMKEIKFIFELRHQNIIRLEKIFFTSEIEHAEFRCNIVMPYIEYSLLSWLYGKKSPITNAQQANNNFEIEEFGNIGTVRTFKEVKKVFRDIINAINFVHERGIAHLDIKFDNILVNDKGEAILIDFGIGKDLNKFSPITTIRYSPGFCPPELLTGPEHLFDHRFIFTKKCDIYSLGVVLFKIFIDSSSHQSQNSIFSLATLSKISSTEPLIQAKGSQSSSNGGQQSEKTENSNAQGTSNNPNQTEKEKDRIIMNINNKEDVTTKLKDSLKKRIGTKFRDGVKNVSEQEIEDLAKLIPQMLSENPGDRPDSDYLMTKSLFFN